MKRLVFLLFALAAVMYAQEPAAPPRTQNPAVSRSVPGRGGDRALPAKPTYTSADLPERRFPVTHSDVYCAGYIGERSSRTQFVAGGLDTPHATRFAEGDIIYLKGMGYQPGVRVSLIRETRDTSRVELFPGQKKLLANMGTMYMELGYADIIEIRGVDTAVAQVEFSCDAVVPGDLVVPFVEKQLVPTMPEAVMDRFPGETPTLTTRIVQSKDFDYMVSSGRKVYLDVGADKGVKPGYHFRVVRDYQPKNADSAEVISYKAKALEDTQKNAPVFPTSEYKNLPRHVIGELLVLTVQPKSATAVLTFTIDAVHLGDVAELEAGGAAPTKGK
jgi:hypothetical protein